MILFGAFIFLIKLLSQLLNTFISFVKVSYFQFIGAFAFIYLYDATNLPKAQIQGDHN